MSIMLTTNTNRSRNMNGQEQDMLASLVEAERKAGEAILDVYGSAVQTELKTDLSPVTAADRLSHEVMSDHLRRHTPFPILSEEGKDIPYDERRLWETFWLLDPLDGTKEFLSRNGEFTVNAALIHQGLPVMGAIYVPVKDLFYTAIKGSGAYRVGDGATARLPLNQRRRECTVVGSRSHVSPEYEAYLRTLRARHGGLVLLSAGSSLKFCLVAEGAADLYPRMGTTMEWDTAAGQLIAEEAGGRVVEAASGSQLRYNKADLRNPHFIVSGRDYHG
jgi:3'(2'), 5'-bisphosphate nucleotidase